jgi:hypothetical protein
MASGTAFADNLDSTGGEVNVVMQHKNAVQGNLEKIDKGSDTLPGPVHKRLRFQKDDLAAKKTTLTVETVHLLRFKTATCSLSQKIDKQETNIVTGQMILTARVSQADKKKSRICHERKKIKKTSRKFIPGSCSDRMQLSRTAVRGGKIS